VTGEEVYSTLYAIRESPRQKGLIWTGSNDGVFSVSRDDGKTWTNVTPKDLPPGGRVQNIEPSPHRAGTAYYAVYRFLLGDFAAYAYRTDDFGRTWKRITDGTNGIAPDEPVRVVREDPDRAHLLYAGTEFGMYVSFDDGAHWQPFQYARPHPGCAKHVHSSSFTATGLISARYSPECCGQAYQERPQSPHCQYA